MDIFNLKKNIKIVFKSAELVYKSQDYTSATILYFKTLFLLLDQFLLEKHGKSPKDHTERFRVLESSEKNYYEFLDKNFRIYRNTYNTTINKTDCDSVRKYVIKFIKDRNIEIWIK